jgi:hypothetical protein
MLLVLALVTLGVGYGLWSETLKINGVVGTGEVDAGWSVEAFGDDEPALKDYSSIICYTEPKEEPGVSPHKLWVVITNAYPSITYYCDFDIHNDGTIPLHIGPFVINRGTLPPLTNLTITDLESTQLEPCEEALGRITVHLKNDAEENKEYTFEVSVDVVQWNEAP